MEAPGRQDLAGAAPLHRATTFAFIPIFSSSVHGMSSNIFVGAVTVPTIHTDKVRSK